MKRLLYIVVCVAAVACCPCRKAGVTQSVSDVERIRDSVYVHHYDTVRVVERDTLRLAPINQWHESVSLKASYSYLENEYCTTTAEVDSDGYLHHTLGTKSEASFPVRIVEVERIVRDTISINTQSNNTTTNSAQSTLIKKVKKSMSWVVKTQIIGFWLLVAGIIIKNRKTIIRVFSGWRI